MINYLLKQIQFYANLHPTRFRLVIVLLVLSALLLLYSVVSRILLKNKTKTRDLDKEAPEFSDDEKPKQVSWIRKQFRVYNFSLWLAFVAVFAGVLIVLNTKVYKPVYPRTENLEISETPYTFGIDISHYQGLINWDEVRKSHHPIEFVFIRATMGHNGKDAYFDYNWKKAKEKEYVRGAYHFYRPHENSTKQFNNFKKHVSIAPGDLPPVLDVEHYSKFGAENLRTGILNWLRLAEAHYGIKPIVYTGSHFYNQILRGHIEGYPLWIADYSRPHHRLNNIDWKFHQFTERVRIKGIASLVDGNDFRGELFDLYELTWKPRHTEEIREPVTTN